MTRGDTRYRKDSRLSKSASLFIRPRRMVMMQLRLLCGELIKCIETTGKAIFFFKYDENM